MWFLATVHELDLSDMYHVVVSDAYIFLEISSRISEIVVERDSLNKATTELLPVLPH